MLISRGILIQARQAISSAWAAIAQSGTVQSVTIHSVTIHNVTIHSVTIHSVMIQSRTIQGMATMRAGSKAILTGPCSVKFSAGACNLMKENPVRA